MCDFRSAQKDVRAGNISDTRMALLYDQFREFCATIQIEHWIDDTSLQMAEILEVYDYQVRHGHWSKLPEVQSDSVSVAWQAIATVHLLDGFPDPQKPCGSSSRNLDICLSHQLRTYSFQDPPTSLIPLSTKIGRAS